MKILLPPSETKRPGGSGGPLDLSALALPELAAPRATVCDALVELASDPEAAARVLKLGVRNRGDVQDNLALRQSPTMPAVERYTGVLYDALDAGSLDASQRRWLGTHVWIHSAPFGPVGALDSIPTYRLAAGVSLPGLSPLHRIWADAVSAALAASQPGFVLDLRSEAYVRLGPVPASVRSAYLRVVTAQGRALNHFNKKAKGELVRRLAQERPRLGSADALLDWAHAAGVDLRRGGVPGEVELVAQQ